MICITRQTLVGQYTKYTAALRRFFPVYDKSLFFPVYFDERLDIIKLGLSLEAVN